MADVIHCDIDSALDAMLKLFWKQGFKATTTKELAKSANLSEGSLYNTFGSKQDVYIRSLQRYRERSMFLLDILENSESPLTGIRKYWEAIAKFAADKKRLSGCMITNATIEQSKDPKISAYLKTVHRDYEKAFKKALDKAVKVGELKPGTDTKALAQYLWHSTQGIRVLARLSPSKKTMQNIIASVLSVLDQHRTI